MRSARVRLYVLKMHGCVVWFCIKRLRIPEYREFMKDVALCRQVRDVSLSVNTQLLSYAKQITVEGNRCVLLLRNPPYRKTYSRREKQLCPPRDVKCRQCSRNRRNKYRLVLWIFIIIIIIIIFSNLQPSQYDGRHAVSSRSRDVAIISDEEGL